MHDDDHSHSGLALDLLRFRATFDRRQLLRGLAGAAALGTIGALGCGSEDTSSGACDTIPEETAGPYPGDGSNGPNALALAGIVRRDLRSSIGGASGVAAGIELTVTLTVVDSAASCGPLSGMAVYLWHCDRDGNYSMYSQAVSGENYLRGVQETDASGQVTFTTVFPGCYAGRMPHIHFEVYTSAAEATSGGDPIATSQLAFPAEPCDAVYATAGYQQSITNFGQIDFDSDNVFSDGVDQQLATVTGSVTEGFVATLQVPVSA